MPRKVLYVTTRLFWPPDSGRKVSLYQYCKGMQERLGYEVHLFSFLEGDQTPDMADEKPVFIESVGLARRVSTRTKVENLFCALLHPDMPLQCCLFRSRANALALCETVTRVEPDVVVLDMVRLAPYAGDLLDLPCAVVVNFDDLLSKRYRRQVGDTGGNVLGKYGTGASGALNALANGPLKNMVLESESRRTERAEARWAAATDASLFISPVEAAELDSRLTAHKCFSAPMGAEVGVAVDPDEPKPYDLGFVGNMHTAANQDSLRYLIREVLPLLPGRTLRVIGVCPVEVVAAYESDEAVSFAGRVDSIAEHLGQCKMLLAPFAYGSGVKTKVLEAMGMGVPVVTNSLGVEGIAAEVGRDLLCANDPEGLALEASRLISDEGLRRRIAENGRAYVVENHTWEKSIGELEKCLDFAAESAEERCG